MNSYLEPNNLKYFNDVDYTDTTHNSGGSGDIDGDLNVLKNNGSAYGEFNIVNHIRFNNNTIQDTAFDAGTISIINDVVDRSAYIDIDTSNNETLIPHITIDRVTFSNGGLQTEAFLSSDKARININSDKLLGIEDINGVILMNRDLSCNRLLMNNEYQTSAFTDELHTDIANNKNSIIVLGQELTDSNSHIGINTSDITTVNVRVDDIDTDIGSSISRLDNLETIVNDSSNLEINSSDNKDIKIDPGTGVIKLYCQSVEIGNPSFGSLKLNGEHQTQAYTDAKDNFINSLIVGVTKMDGQSAFNWLCIRSSDIKLSYSSGYCQYKAVLMLIILMSMVNGTRVQNV